MCILSVCEAVSQVCVNVFQLQDRIVGFHLAFGFFELCCVLFATIRVDDAVNLLSLFLAEK